MNYEAVIGLEVHVQIKTRSKVFTRVGAGYGHEPNTLTDPVVLALPGTLPVMNKAALDAIQILGGNGYINDYPTGRLLRDAKLYEIGAGTSEIRRLLIGRELFRETA